MEQNDDRKTREADALERVTRAMLKEAVDAGKAKPEEFEVTREGNDVFILDSKSGITSKVVPERDEPKRAAEDKPKLNRAARRKMEAHWRRVGKKKK